VQDLVTGVSKVLIQRADLRRFDGLRWTAWGTLLVAEEVTGGRLFEVTLDPDDPSTAATVTPRPALASWPTTA
jgi:uncharacterized protein